ncbi:class I SAM-dependent methyltransferase [Paraburkholderia sp. J63]|uniref:class I SAM-dependent methyltransferase n=1 Tax=Paraburkholderia sp. J63 TaxID=2805434 RepID=UPI002ABE8883|nr:class I SAM-dependent methyltransferase [Paraburkholderia sp. J63]
MRDELFPELNSTQIHADARLFANRYDLLSSMIFAKGGVIAEIGVAAGSFSQFILEALNPEVFYALDTFGMHKYPMYWGEPSEIKFKGMTHLDFYREQFLSRGDQVKTIQGLSYETLPLFPDNFFDLIYVDAGHSYDEVRRDAWIARDKIKFNGVLIFNDYTMYDQRAGESYGVVQAVNQLIVEDGWVVTGFALHKDMFCDIAIRKPDAS